MKRSLLCWLGMLGACGGAGSGLTVSPIEFSSGGGTVQNGVCTAEANLVSLSDDTTVLVSIAAHLTDSSGTTGTFELDSDSFTVPPSSTLTLPLTFDLSSEGLTSPAQGPVVILGTTSMGTTQFVGTVHCGS